MLLKESNLDTMRRSALFFVIVTMLGMIAVLLSSCQKEKPGESGTMHLSITDAPVDTEGIAAVYITIKEIQYHHNGSWKILEPFEGPQTYNLLDLTHGISAMLGSFELQAGIYNQIRFIVDAPLRGATNIANPGCFLEFDDGTTAPLFIPSGAQTGYKAIGQFVVPVNGDVFLTADFDVRKSIVKAGSTGKYILKPFIRLVAEDQAGMIKGKILNADAETTTIVYAYTAGKYKPEEANDPEAETPRFPNAISSDRADEQGRFTLAFMAEGKYDLVIASNRQGAFSQVLGIVNDIEVFSRKITLAEIDVSDLD